MRITLRRSIPVLLVALLVAVTASTARPVAAASDVVALELHVTPNPMTPGTDVVISGAVNRVSGSPKNVKVDLYYGSGMSGGTCSPACSSEIPGSHAYWTFPVVTGRTLFTYSGAGYYYGGYVQAFLIGGSAACYNAGCWPRVDTERFSLAATIRYEAGAPVLQGSTVHVVAGGTANVPSIDGGLTVQLPPGTGVPSNLSAGATYSPDPYHQVSASVMLTPSALEFDLPITAANGSSLALQAWFDPYVGGPGNVDAATTVKVGPDSSDPKATTPKVTLVSGTRVGGAPVRLAWSGSDSGSGVERFVLAQQVDGGTWTTLSSAITTTTVTRKLPTGHTYRFRVRAVDHAGNAGAWARGESFVLKGYADGSKTIWYSGTWKRATSASYWGGSVRKATAIGATATFTTKARAIAWVTTCSPSRGRAKVYVDGKAVAMIDLWSLTSESRRVVWAKSWSRVATHKITIKVISAPGRQRVDVDGMVATR